MSATPALYAKVIFGFSPISLWSRIDDDLSNTFKLLICQCDIARLPILDQPIRLGRARDRDRSLGHHPRDT